MRSITIRLNDHEEEQLNRIIETYRKQNAATVVLEIYELYVDQYEEMEKAKLKSYEEQIPRLS
jgi:hypothetical protein